jgi:hypothetical protein
MIRMGIGFFIGISFGLYTADTGTSLPWWRFRPIGPLCPGYMIDCPTISPFWWPALFWAVAGAMMAAALVHIKHRSRS